MKIYTVYRVPASPSENVTFIKDGFSWPAFFVPLIWLVVKRLWLEFVLYVAAVLAISALPWLLHLPDTFVGLLSVLLHFWLGLEGNNLLRRSLERRTFLEEGVAMGQNREEAELHYFSRTLPTGAIADTGRSVAVAGAS